MAKLIAVYDKCENLKLKKRQLPIIVDDNKIMVMQLGEACECCELLPIVEYSNGIIPMITQTADSEKEESFCRQYNMLSREEALSALMVPAKSLFNRLAQVVGCVGCRRSVERLFYQLKESGNPAMEPLVITASGLLTVLMKISLQPRILYSLFAEHRGMSEIFSAIPKLKKSGRCLLHSMEGVRCRPGSQAWLEMWEGMTAKCKDTITLINSDQLLTTLDNYLRKHRFCHECKNKVHRAYNILVGNINIDPAKEKGYVATLYAGIRKCSKKHIHISSETDYLMHLITRAEPELQGRRERHAKTLEIAQEEVLTCIGLFLYERLQRVQTKLREEEQTWEILFHIGLDALRKNFELAVEEKQGFSKFELLCEELQRQEIIEKAKKEKKKKKKNKKKVDESKEVYSCEDEQSCEDCENNQSSSPIPSKKRSTQIPLEPALEDEVSANEDDELGPEWIVQGKPNGIGKIKNKVKTAPRNGVCNVLKVESTKDSRSNSSLDTFEEFIPHRTSSSYHNGQSHSPCIMSALETETTLELSSHQTQLVDRHESSPPHLSECSASIDSLASRCSQCSRDGGYCSAPCSSCSNNGSSGSSRDSSEVACGDGLCSHADDPDHPHCVSQHSDHTMCIIEQNGLIHDDGSRECEKENIHWRDSGSISCTMSLQQMLDDSSCGADEIPEAEVRAWRARQGIVKQKRAELRQTLKQRFQQLCHRKTLFDTNGKDKEIVKNDFNLKLKPLINGISLVGK